jgi:hypothetical protein
VQLENRVASQRTAWRTSSDLMTLFIAPNTVTGRASAKCGLVSLVRIG